MTLPLEDRIADANTRLRSLLDETTRALSGQGDFGVDQVRAFSQVISEMAPILERAAELRALHPELTAPLDLYRSQLGELHIALQHVHMMLLARRSELGAHHAQVDAVSQWANALSSTR